MAALDGNDFPCVELGLAARSRPGETESGDRALARRLGNGVLLAVIDGLGHGAAAAGAALAAAAALEDAPDGSPLAELLQRCHGRVRKTRGVAMSLAVIDPERETLAWIGVGDVEAVLLRDSGRRRETLALRPGVVGHRLPAHRQSELPLAGGDTLVLATDGLRRGVAGTATAREPAAEVARRLLESGARDEDDALVLVARYLGGGGA